MTTPRNTGPTQERDADQFGLLACGSSGGWDVAVDEDLSGSERWYVQIEGPTVSFSFEIPSLDLVGEMLRFLERGSVAAEGFPNGSDAGNGSLVIGKDLITPVKLVQDDEYPDRFFLVVGQTNSPMVWFTIASPDAGNIAEGLRQMQEDLVDEG